MYINTSNSYVTLKKKMFSNFENCVTQFDDVLYEVTNILSRYRQHFLNLHVYSIYCYDIFLFLAHNVVLTNVYFVQKSVQKVQKCAGYWQNGKTCKGFDVLKTILRASKHAVKVN